MNVLLIEDDDFKARKIKQVVDSHRAVTSLQIARSVNSGLASLAQEMPDLLLLDMSLTTFDLGPDEGGGRPRNFGGIEIFEELSRIQAEVPVIVITQFETFTKDNQIINIADIRKGLKRNFAQIFKAIIYYDVNGAWKGRLDVLLSKYGRGK